MRGAQLASSERRPSRARCRRRTPRRRAPAPQERVHRARRTARAPSPPAGCRPHRRRGSRDGAASRTARGPRRPRTPALSEARIASKGSTLRGVGRRPGIRSPTRPKSTGAGVEHHGRALPPRPRARLRLLGLDHGRRDLRDGEGVRPCVGQEDATNSLRTHVATRKRCDPSMRHAFPCSRREARLNSAAVMATCA